MQVVRLRLWTAALLLTVLVALFALDASRLELLESGLRRYLPGDLSGRLAYRLEAPGGVRSYSDRFRDAALDPERTAVERLGAAELFWLCADPGQAYQGEEFERHLEVLLAAAADLPEEPAACALVVEALRAHRTALGLSLDRQGSGESLLARELIRLSRSHDPDNGYFDLFAAEVALSEGRIAEARDSLVRASRTRYLDPLIRHRSAAAYHFLRGLGLPDLETREFLLGDAYPVRGSSAAEMLEGIGRQLGQLDASGEAEDQDEWIETCLAVHDACLDLSVSALLKQDVYQAVDGEAAYLEAVRSGVAGLRGAGGPSGRSERELLEAAITAAGFTHGAARLRRDAALLRTLDLETRRDRSHSADVIRLTAAHALFLPWIAASLLAALLCLPAAIRGRRRKVPIPSSPGIFLAAALTPIGLLLFLGMNELYPFQRADFGRNWLAALAHPERVVYLFPLVASLVVCLPHVLMSRYRNLASFSRRAAAFFLAYALLLLLAFAATAPLVDEQRRLRASDLNGLLLERDGLSAWPGIGTDS